MKVLFLTGRAGDGGSERFVESLTAEYAARGIECVLAYSEEGPLLGRMEKLGAGCVRLDLSREAWFSAPKEIARICAEEGADVIHAQFPRENIYALRSLRHFGKMRRAAGKTSGGREARVPRVIFTDHLSVDQGAKWRLLNRLYCGRLYGAATVWDDGAEVLKNNGFPPEKICVIYNGTAAADELTREEAANGNEAPDAENAGKAVREELGIGPAEFLCCVLARYSPEKGLDFLLDSLKLLKEKTDRLFCCVICGDGELFGHIKDRITCEGLGDCVIQAGFREDVGRILGASRLYLSPSESEAMSLGLLEAFAAGLPAVVTDVGSSGRITEEEPCCGISVDYPDADGFAEAIKRYMEDDALLREHAAAALAKAPRFGRSAMAENYLRLCEQGPENV